MQVQNNVDLMGGLGSSTGLDDSRLNPLESEQNARLDNIITKAEYVWRDKQDAKTWLTAPHPELGSRPPIDAAMDEFGARRVEEILEAILHGMPT